MCLILNSLSFSLIICSSLAFAAFAISSCPLAAFAVWAWSSEYACAFDHSPFMSLYSDDGDRGPRVEEEDVLRGPLTLPLVSTDPAALAATITAESGCCRSVSSFLRKMRKYEKRTRVPCQLQVAGGSRRGNVDIQGVRGGSGEIETRDGIAGFNANASIGRKEK